jgi:hypothetical protein
MTIEKTYVAPALPYAPVTEFNATFMDGYSRILRLYFNLNDNLIDQILELLNNGGYFPELNAGEFNGGNFNGDTANLDLVNAGQVVAALAYLQTLYAGGVQAQDVLANNVTGSNVNGSLFTGSGRQLNFPHIGASGNADQYATANDTPTIVQWDTADEILGFTLNNDYTATPTYNGVYKITYGLQFANTDNAAHDVVIWIRVNGTDVVKSAVKYTLPARKSAGVPSYLLAGSTIVFDIQAGQSVGLWWATDKAYSTTGPVDGVYIEYLPAQTTPYAHPAVPASIGDISYVSAPFPPKTQVALVGVAGVGAVGSVSILVY